MRRGLVVVFVAALLLLVGAVSAQESLTGTISADTPTQEFTLPLAAGDTAQITVEATSGDLDPIVQVFDLNGEVAVENDDIDTAGGNFNSAVTYTAPADGDYLIIVSSFGGTNGDFIITVSYSAGTAPAEDSTSAVGGANSETVEGTITDDAPAQYFTVTLAAGDPVTITAQATSGDLDTYLVIDDPDGNVIAENDDIDFDGGIYDSQVAFVAPIAGDYEIEVTRFDGQGDFLLTVDYGVFDEGAGTVVGGTAEGELSFSGTITDAQFEQVFTVDLFANETVFATAEATSGDLDTVLRVLDQNGRVLAENDDYDPRESFNSALTFTTGTAGTYQFVVTRYLGADGDSSGDFVLTIYRGVEAEAAESAIGAPAGVVNDVTGSRAADLTLSGETRILESDNFRVFYTLEGEDAATPEYIDALIATLEEAYVIQRDQLGFFSAPNIDGRYDVYVYDVVGKQENALGYAQPLEEIGDNPNSPIRESHAMTALLAMDNDYDVAGDQALRVMRATATHELNHVLQFGYDSAEPHFWLFEATASWIEVATFPTDEEASGYLQSSMGYPEVCFGAGTSTPDTNIMYGTWLYMQSLAEAHEPRIVSRLWENIAGLDGFEALEATLNEYGDTLVDSVIRYHLLNLLRGYEVVDLIQFGVWVEDLINNFGKWEATGQGVQELGANYFEFALPPGTYDLFLGGSGARDLDLYVVGISGAQADLIALGQGGTFDNSAYDTAYVIVFNPVYDADVDSCRYVRYDLNLSEGSATPVEPITTLNAANFQPPAVGGGS